MRNFLGIFCCLFLLSTVQAEIIEDESEILAKRGKGVVTQGVFTARADKIPADIRFAALRDGNRVRELINTLLLRDQLATEARETGFDKDPVVVNRMKLAADAELANAWTEHYVAMQPAADYEQLAREYYLSNQDEFFTSLRIDVSHILISTEEHSDEEARALADLVSQKIDADPGSFDELVVTYSEDPSASSNKGKFKDVKKGDMVEAFEKAAFSLKKDEVSGLVKTQYGYHIIRLDARYEPERIIYDQVRMRLIESERNKHEARIRRDYLEGFTALEVKMSEDALIEMVRRQFGEDVIKSKTDGEDSE